MWEPLHARIQYTHAAEVPLPPAQRGPSWSLTRPPLADVLQVGQLVNLGVICYLKQLLETGFFHADPHPGACASLHTAAGCALPITCSFPTPHVSSALDQPACLAVRALDALHPRPPLQAT
jgi:hypothetical protein